MKTILAVAASLTILASAASATTYPPCTATRTDSCMQKQPNYAAPVATPKAHRR